MQAKSELVPPSYPRPKKVAVLTVLGNGGAARVFRVHKHRIVIGSMESTDVPLPEGADPQVEEVSPIHAVVEMTGQPTIFDLASKSGVYVNGARVATRGLKDGDLIKIGSQTLKFASEDYSSDYQPITKSDDYLIEEPAAVPIFKYPDPSALALEVVVSWCGSILEVGHYDLSHGLGAKKFPFLNQSGRNFVLNLAPDTRGIIQRNGQLKTVREVVSDLGSEIPILPQDFAKISQGELEYFISYTSAPPVLVRRTERRDPLLLKLVFTSLLLTVSLITALFRIEVSPFLEAEELPERIVSILYQPEKYSSFSREDTAEPQEPVAKKKEVAEKTKIDLSVPVKPHPAKEIALGPQGKKSQQGKKSRDQKASVGQKRAKEGQGARAKGPEGTRGTKKAPTAPTQQQRAMRPSPNRGKGAGGSQSQVAGEGNLDSLKGASERILDLLGSSSGKLGKGGQKLQGFGGFDTRGTGGLALSGERAGGGGSADALGGLAKKGRGGGRVGTGLGAAGTGEGIVGGKSRLMIRSGGPEEAVVMGAIDAGAVEAALVAHRDEFRLCYEREINAGNPGLAGVVGTSFVIGSRGRVTQAGVSHSSLKNINTERCILRVIRRVQFPIPRGGGVVEVTKPFKFRPIGN